MRTVPLLISAPFLLPVLAAQAPAASAPQAASSAEAPTPKPKELSGKDLPKVPGPLVDRYAGARGYRDPAMGPGLTPLERQIRSSARSGPSIPALGLPSEAVAVSDTIGSVAGWKAYRVEVPAGAKVHARIHGLHEGWFRMRTVNRMGSLEKGMLQNLIPTGNPEASYTNPKTVPSVIYFVVDTTQPNLETEPYTLVVDWPKPDAMKAK